MRSLSLLCLVVVAACDDREINVGALDLALLPQSPYDAQWDKSMPVPEPDMTLPIPPAICPGGVDGGVDPCLSGRTFEYPPTCLVGGADGFADNATAFVGRDYASVLEFLRKPNTCDEIAKGGIYGMARAGVCGDYLFIETQGLGLGVIVHRFYDGSGKLVGAQTRDDIGGKCYKSYGLIPNCVLVQCELICHAHFWTC